MLTHPTADRLRELGLTGMARALEEQRRHPDAAELSFEDRLAMLVEREALERDSKRLAARLRFAGLRQQATSEDVDHRAARGLDRALFQRLTNGEWIERRQDLLVTDPTGTGKTWLSCALGHRACRDNRSVLYQRVPRLLEGLGLARGDGRYARMLKSLARVQLLILDDWAITPLTAEQRRDGWRSSTTGTTGPPPSSPARSRSSTGMSTSAIRRSPMRCSTASCTAPIASS